MQAQKRTSQSKKHETRGARYAKKLASLQDKSEKNAQARLWRKRKKRAERALAKAKNFRKPKQTAEGAASAAPAPAAAPAAAPAKS